MPVHRQQLDNSFNDSIATNPDRFGTDGYGAYQKIYARMAAAISRSGIKFDDCCVDVSIMRKWVSIDLIHGDLTFNITTPLTDSPEIKLHPDGCQTFFAIHYKKEMLVANRAPLPDILQKIAEAIELADDPVKALLIARFDNEGYYS